MRKLAIVAVLIFSLMAGAIGFAQAQTPESQSAEEEIHGASIEIIADTTSESGEVGMTLYRIILEPDADPIPKHEHYGSVTWYIDSGTLGFTVTSGEVWVRCADECVPGATPDASGFVLVPEETEVVLEAGDWIIQHDTTVHAYHNAGDDTVVIDASTTWPIEDEPSMDDAGPMATPAAPRYLIRGCGGGCM